MNGLDWEQRHNADLAKYSRQIGSIYRSAAEEAAAIGAAVPNFDTSKPFAFADYPKTKKRVDNLFKSLSSQIETAIVNGVDSQWTLANNKNNELCNWFFGDFVGKLSKAQERRYYSNNDKAREAFKARKITGLGLSDRVWKYTDQFKSEIELGIDLGLRDGLPAAEMARDLKGYLQAPDKLFRRVRDEHGVLRLSQAAKAYHPGQGVYRSSYKNALRLTATETNIAYRTSDHERWQQLDFVIGIEIKKSNNHSVADVCDQLAGKYPKGFKFTGWHPHCRCYAIPILQKLEDFIEDRPITGEVEATPDNYNEWVAENEGRFTSISRTPYFIRDNSTYTPISRDSRGLMAKRIATDRHAARTPHQIADIQNRWGGRHASTIMGVQPIDTIDKVQGVVNRFLELYPNETNGKAIAIGIYKKQSVNGGFSIMRANSPKGTIELNNICYPQMSDSPYTRLKTALDKIRQKEVLSFDEEYSVESLYHEILHCKAKEWRRLLPHNKGDYKRTAMETVNQFVSRHEYPNFIKKLGGKAINHAEVLGRGMGYSDWVGNFRKYISVAKIDEVKAFNYFKDKLLNQSYDSLDDVLASYIKENAGNALNAYSNKDILESLQTGGIKWQTMLNLLKTK